MRRGDRHLRGEGKVDRHRRDDTEGPPILAELAVAVGDADAGRLIEPLARQDPEAAGQMFPESLRSLYALTLHRQGYGDFPGGMADSLIASSSVD